MESFTKVVDNKFYYEKIRRDKYNHYMCNLNIKEVDNITKDKHYIIIFIHFFHKVKKDENTYANFVNKINNTKELYYGLKNVLFSDLLNDLFQESEIEDFQGPMYNDENIYVSYGNHGGRRAHNSFIEFRLEKKKMYYGYDCLTDDQFNWLWLIINEYVIRHKREHKYYK